MQLLVFLAALIASAVFTSRVRDIAIARRWVFIPNSDRHVHARPMPRLGGLAIFLTLWCGALLARAAPQYFGAHGLPWSDVILKILGPATLIFVFGLIDDFRGLSAYVKFAVQMVAAGLLYYAGVGITYVSIAAGHPHLSWIAGLPLTVIWVLWITNAFNLIDGLDGLAAGAALFSTVVTFVVAIIFHNEGILFLSLVLAGAIAGFLRYNFNPASIFLGDCGSLLIGFLLSAMAIAGSQKSPTVVAVAIPMVSLGLPIMDVAVAVARRFLSCKELFAPDREHIHHMLLNRCASHRKAVLVLYGVSACFGLFSLSLLAPNGRAEATILVVVGIGILIGVQQLRYPEFSELGRAASRAMNQRRVMANNIGIHRALNDLGSCSSYMQFRQILQKCLSPVGFDGFVLELSSKVSPGAGNYPFLQAPGYRLQSFWNHLMTPAEANWSMTFGLPARTGERLGSMTLYRKDTSFPIWVDLNVFTATTFYDVVADVIEKMRDSWSAHVRKEQPQVTGLAKARSVVA